MENEREWDKEFDEKFRVNEDWTSDGAWAPYYKDFIRQLLTTERERGKEEVLAYLRQQACNIANVHTFEETFTARTPSEATDAQLDVLVSSVRHFSQHPDTTTN